METDRESIVVAARYLAPGDYLVGSRRVVDSVQPMGARTRVATSRGSRAFCADWRSSTTVRVLRAPRIVPTFPPNL